MFRIAIVPIVLVLALPVASTTQSAQAAAGSFHPAAAVDFVVVPETHTPVYAVRHLSLRSSAPANRATVESPTEIRLWFSERPQARTTSVTLIGPSGSPVGLGAVAADADDERVYFARPEAALVPGAYRVSWRTMAQDGHAIRGEFTFTVAVD